MPDRVSSVGEARGRAHFVERALQLLLVAALLGGLFLPVYSDEVGWRFQERAAIDGVDKFYTDLCGPSTLAQPPFFMMPVRLFSAFFNTHFPSPFYVRLSGIAYALLLVAMVGRLIVRLDLPEARRRSLAIVAYGLLGAGLMPLLLVWSRPEQPVLLAAIGLVLLGLGPRDEANESRGNAMRMVWFTLCVVVAFSYHIKGLILIPVALSAIFGVVRGTRVWPWRLGLALGTGVVAVWSAHYWIARLQCPGNPAIAAFHARLNTGLGGVRGDPLAALGSAFNNAQFFQYSMLLAPRTNPMSQWLIENAVSPTGETLWRIPLHLVWGIFLLWGVAALALGLWSCLGGGHRGVARGERGRDIRQLALALALALAVVVWSATLTVRNVYEATFVLTLWLVVTLLSVGVNLRREAKRRGLAKGVGIWPLAVLARLLPVLTPISLVLVVATYGPSLARASQQSGFIAAQPHSIGLFGFDRIERQTASLARSCAIPIDGRAQAVLLDETTYFPLMQTRLPQLRLIESLPDMTQSPSAYLASRGSSGAIARCDQLPRDLLRRAHRLGDYCCVARQSLGETP